MRIIGITTALISMLLASVLGIVIAMLSIGMLVWTGSAQAKPVKLQPALHVTRGLSFAKNLTVVLLALAAVLALCASPSMALIAYGNGSMFGTVYGGSRQLSIPRLAEDPTKWVLAFDVGRNVNSTRVHDPNTTQEERDHYAAWWRPDPPTHPADWVRKRRS